MDYSRFPASGGADSPGPEKFAPVDIDKTQHISGPNYADMFKRAQAERAAEEDEKLRDFDNCELPWYKNSPHHLDAFRDQEAFREATRPLTTLRQERDRLRAEGDREQLPAVEAEYGKRFDEAVRPLLEARLADNARLPHYDHNMARYHLRLLPAVPFEERTSYGRCKVDVDRIIATPAFSNWSAEGNSKLDAQSDELIVGHALDMLRGDYDVAKANTSIKLRAAVMPDGNYVYLLDDGSHRVAAAKLIGERTIEAKVTADNFRPDDRVGRLADEALRSEAAAGEQKSL